VIACVSRGLGDSRSNGFCWREGLELGSYGMGELAFYVLRIESRSDLWKEGWKKVEGGLPRGSEGVEGASNVELCSRVVIENGGLLQLNFCF
jgi:hypothetical protein